MKFSSFALKPRFVSFACLRFLLIISIPGKPFKNSGLLCVSAFFWGDNRSALISYSLFLGILFEFAVRYLKLISSCSISDMFEDPFVLDAAPPGKSTAGLIPVPSHIFTLFPPPSEEVNIHGKIIEENTYKDEGGGSDGESSLWLESRNWAKVGSEAFI
jgi:hypothetical protein